MIKTGLFAEQERESKLNRLGDALQVMEQHVDFAALAAEVDLAAPRPSREGGGRPPFQPCPGLPRFSRPAMNLATKLTLATSERDAQL